MSRKKSLNFLLSFIIIAFSAVFFGINSDPGDDPRRGSTFLDAPVLKDISRSAGELKDAAMDATGIGRPQKMPVTGIVLTPGWLKDQEGGEHNGHTIRRHVGKDEDYLRSRLKGRYGSKPVPEASSYPDLETAENTIEKMFKKYRKRVEVWIEDPDSPPVYAIEYRGDDINPLGYGMKRGQITPPSPRYNARLVLKKTSDGYGVLTSFPR